MHPAIFSILIVAYLIKYLVTALAGGWNWDGRRVTYVTNLLNAQKQKDLIVRDYNGKGRVKRGRSQ